MTWFLVVIFQIILVLVSLAIVASSYELPRMSHIPNIPKIPQQPLDKDTEIHDNDHIEIDQ